MPIVPLVPKQSQETPTPNHPTAGLPHTPKLSCLHCPHPPAYTHMDWPVHFTTHSNVLGPKSPTAEPAHSMYLRRENTNNQQIIFYLFFHSYLLISLFWLYSGLNRVNTEQFLMQWFNIGHKSIQYLINTKNDLHIYKAIVNGNLFEVKRPYCEKCWYHLLLHLNTHFWTRTYI